MTRLFQILGILVLCSGMLWPFDNIRAADVSSEPVASNQSSLPSVQVAVVQQPAAQVIVVAPLATTSCAHMSLSMTQNLAQDQLLVDLNQFTNCWDFVGLRKISQRPALQLVGASSQQIVTVVKKTGLTIKLKTLQPSSNKNREAVLPLFEPMAEGFKVISIVKLRSGAIVLSQTENLKQIHLDHLQIMRC